MPNNKTCLFSFDDIFHKEINVPEVRLIISKYKDDTAAGYDTVTVQILKNISEPIITPIVFIYNLSIQNSIFPDDFKTVLIPLFKEGDHKYMSNYRPISFLKYLKKLIKQDLLLIWKIRAYYLKTNSVLDQD